MADTVSKLDAEDIVTNITEIESLCMNCREQGITRLLPLRIPYFREVIVSSFSCSHCGFDNRELMPAATYDDLGLRYELSVEKKEDLNRQVAQVKYATIRIPELDFEAPSTRGNLTTVEGVIVQVADNLTDLIERSKDDESQRETVVKLTEFVQKLRGLLEFNPVNNRLLRRWTLHLTDPTGTSYIENPNAPHRDERLRVARFRRSAADNELIGLSASTDAAEANGTDMETDVSGNKKRKVEETNGNHHGTTAPVRMPETPSNGAVNPNEDRADKLMEAEAVEFQTQCGACRSQNCMTRMKTVAVPHFRDVIVMATTCDACGWRDAEVKSGGAMQPKGVRFVIRVDEREDLNRMVLRSDSASVLLPELDFESSSSSASSKLTTVEGILTEIRDHMLSTVERANKDGDTTKPRNETTLFGDSLDNSQIDRIRAFCTKIDDVVQMKMTGIHVVIDDAAGNAFVAFATDKPEDDTRLKRIDYERTHEQNETLGINDMKVDNYY